MSDREQWSSELTFIMAALGSAVGLGNIWRFPYVAGANGGGAFVILYLLFILGVGLPALIATIMIGRRGKLSPIRCFEKVAQQEGLSKAWIYLGWMLVISAFLLLSYFSVVASWTFDYLFKSVSGAFSGLDADSSVSLFGGLTANPLRLALWHGLFMAFTLLIVGRGIRRGIERAIKIMMPALFVLMLVLTVYSLIVGAAAQALSFLFTPDFGRIDSSTALIALGAGPADSERRWRRHDRLWRLPERRGVYSSFGGRDCLGRYRGRNCCGTGDLSPGICLWTDARRGAGIDIRHSAHCVRSDAGRNRFRNDVLPVDAAGDFDVGTINVSNPWSRGWMTPGTFPENGAPCLPVLSRGSSGWRRCSRSISGLRFGRWDYSPGSKT